GVNDAPALRKADVGVAMGIVGTDVAKEAADIILTNDNFGAIVSAIEEGRGVFDNVRKFITYIFSSNVPEILPFLVTATFPAIPLALTVRQILAIDLGTDFFPAIALGMEKPEPNVMKKPPRRPNQPLIDNKLLMRAFLWLGMIETALCYVGFFSVYLFTGNAQDSGLGDFLLSLPYPDFLMLEFSAAEAHILAVTVFHAGVVMAQVGNAFACRSESERGRRLGWVSNRYLLLAVALEIATILAIIYIEPLAAVFGHQPIPPVYWLGLSLFGVILYSLDWIRKQFVRRMRRAAPAEAQTS
ncbi:MAG: HAD-IC family P-type ATPase, partial [Anaerolineales bacterium]